MKDFFRKMICSKIFRSVLCVLLALCIVFNVTSTPAKAIAIADDIAIGLFALLVLGAAGVVLVPQASSEIVDIGNAFKSSMYQWGTSAEKLDEVQSWIDSFSNLDPDDSPNETKVKLARGILAGITAWIASTIIAGKIESEGDVAPDGYKYYNGVLLPEIPDYFSNSSSCILYSNVTGNFICYNFSNLSSIQLYPNQPYGCYCALSNSMSMYFFILDGNKWIMKNSWSNVGFAYLTDRSDGVSKHMCDYIFSPYDVYDNAGNFLYPAFEPSTTKTTTYVPTTYVGDLPQQIKDGEKDETDIVLPEAIDFSKLLQDGKTLEQSVTDTLTQLSDGTLTHAVYLTQIEAAPESTPETQPDSSTETVPDPLPDSDFISQTWLGGILERIISAILSIPTAIIDALTSIFVPTEDYLTDKVEAMQARFSFADSIIQSAKAVGGAFEDFYTEPPVIYAELKNATGKYNYGNRAIVLDLRWYADYKPTVDVLISAFLWAVFIWKMFLRLPGIISGMPGDFVMDSAENFGLRNVLPSRSLDYAERRQSFRDKIRGRKK